MNGFLIALEASDPARNVFRSYEVTAGRDLFGDWLVDVRYGRIGARGRTLRQAFSDEAAARRHACACVRGRRSSPRRIGIPYVVKQLDDGFGWLEETGKSILPL